jgi:malonyl CoA-acyl carrier protein transacylase
MSASYLDVPLFAGQGTEAVNSLRAREQALHDATSPSGALLLSSCFDAFHKEISTLSLLEIEQSGIDRADFGSPKDILSSLPEHHVNNPIISSTKLFLFQCLRYLAHLETSNSSPSPSAHFLKANASYNLGVLGFSSGILTACVVAASQSTLTYISNSVEAFRLAFWIGARTQDYRRTVLGNERNHLPWSVVLLGIDAKEAEAAIDAFQCKVRKSYLITSLAII